MVERGALSKHNEKDSLTRTVSGLYIRSGSGQMVPADALHLLPGMGILGQIGDPESPSPFISIITEEELVALNAERKEWGLTDIDPRLAARNIVVENVAPSALQMLLPDQETRHLPGAFTIGKGVFVGVEEVKGFITNGLSGVPVGGINARIIAGGMIKRGDVFQLPKQLR